MSEGRSLMGTPAFYRSSGKVSPVSLVVAALVLVPLAIVLGMVYSAAVVYLPFIKLRGLVTFFTGLLLGGIAGKLCYNLKYRNRPLAFLTIFGFIFLAYYTSWAVHPALVIGRGKLGDEFVNALVNGFDPLLIYGWMQDIFDNGIWGMGGGNALAGWAVVGVWLLEAGFIFIGGMMTGLRTYGNRPFCEPCNRWNDETEDLAVLPVSRTDPAWNQIQNGNFDALRKLQIDENRNNSYVELRLADCPSCDESDYLSAIGITLTVDNGELKKKESAIFRHLSVSREQRDEIVAFAQAMAEAVEEMNHAAAEDFQSADGEANEGTDENPSERPVDPPS
ncbi:MAG: hypothetical protein AAFV88_17920 [Planctomycetota bacterium]